MDWVLRTLIYGGHCSRPDAAQESDLLRRAKMSLDLHQVATQIQDMASYLRQRHGDWQQHLQTGLAALLAAET